MTQTTTIKIDIAKPNIPVVIYAKQHDADTRKVEASLYDNGQEYTIDTDNAVVSIAKPDGTGCLYNADSIDENKVTFTLIEQALTAAGKARAEISLYITEFGETSEENVVERLTSFAFDIIIEPRVIEDSTIVSSDYFNAFLEAVSGYSEATRSVTFTPSVDSNGLLEWSNDGGLTNPESVNIKGPAGADGQDGQDGQDGVITEIDLTHYIYNTYVIRPGIIKILKYTSNNNITITNNSNIGVEYNNSVSLVVLVITDSSVSATFYQNGEGWTINSRSNSETINGAGTYLIFAKYTITSTYKNMAYEVIKL